MVIPTQPQRAFTLIEMSVVLVIIGLIVGGVVVGQHLIRAAQLQSVVTDVQRYIQALNAFQQKYNALPGDMANATDYWGTASGGCPYGAGSGMQTCNGNGDGQINWGAPGYEAEPMRAWQHLANAGFIEGQYTGTAGANHGTGIIGSNVPASKVAGGGYFLYYQGTMISDPNWFDAPYGDSIGLGANIPNTLPGGLLLSPSEALSIDGKMDDGKPGTGKVLTYRGPPAPRMYPCATTNNPATSTYNITLKGPQCMLIFITGL